MNRAPGPIGGDDQFHSLHEMVGYVLIATPAFAGWVLEFADRSLAAGSSMAFVKRPVQQVRAFCAGNIAKNPATSPMAPWRSLKIYTETSGVCWSTPGQTSRNTQRPRTSPRPQTGHRAMPPGRIGWPRFHAIASVHLHSPRSVLHYNGESSNPLNSNAQRAGR